MSEDNGKQEEYERKDGERDGSVSKEVHLTAEKGKYLVEVQTSFVEVSKTPKQELYDGISLIGRFFKDLLSPEARQSEDHGIDPEDVRIYVEVEKERFLDEWQVVCEKGPGGYFKVKEEEPDDLTRFIPNLKVKGEEFDADNQEE